jgi:hypothetical protein
MKVSDLLILGLAWGFSPTKQPNRICGALAPGLWIPQVLKAGAA